MSLRRTSQIRNLSFATYLCSVISFLLSTVSASVSFCDFCGGQFAIAFLPTHLLVEHIEKKGKSNKEQEQKTCDKTALSFV